MFGVLWLGEGDDCPATAGADRVFQPEVNSSAFQFNLMHIVDLLRDGSCDPSPPLQDLFWKIICIKSPPHCLVL